MCAQSRNYVGSPFLETFVCVCVCVCVCVYVCVCVSRIWNYFLKKQSTIKYLVTKRNSYADFETKKQSMTCIKQDYKYHS